MSNKEPQRASNQQSTLAAEPSPETSDPSITSKAAPSSPETPPSNPDAETDAEEEAALLRQEMLNAETLRRQRKVRILIPSGRDPHEQCPVPVGVNGRSYLIERDKEVAVPESVLHVLNLAVEMVPVVSEDGGYRVVGFRHTPRVPVQVLGYEG